MAPQYIFTMHRVSKVHPPDKTVLNDVTLAFLPGAKIGVLGYNGSGKSTLLRIMAGRDTDVRGDAMLAPGASVGLLEQEPHLDEAKDVRGNVMEGVAETAALVERFNELAANYSDETADEFAELQAKIDAADAWNLDTNVEYAMDALRLPPADADVTTLSGGERRRVALCRLLLSQPDLLLLDEPTNHLDAESVAWLEQHLAEYKGTVVAVTHDRYFLDNVAGWILELDRGRGLPYEGNYSSWLEQKGARLAIEEKSEKARQRTIAAELDWVRQNPKGRQKKQKARLANFDALVAQERNVKLDEVQIHIPTATHLGGVVVESEGLRKGFADKLLIDGLDFSLPPGGIVGIIGANGAGKTTLFRMITGSERPDGGTLRVGETVQMSYVDQSRDALDGDKTVWEEISGGIEQIKVGEAWMNSRAYVAASTSRAPTSRRRWPGSPAASATACTWPSSCARAATCCSSTSRRTTSTSTPCARSRRRCSPTPAAPWSSPTIAGSSTASPRTSSAFEGTRRSRGSRGTSRSASATATSSWAPRPTAAPPDLQRLTRTA